MKTKLTVKTDVGTFTRTTARTYGFVVVGVGANDAYFERMRAFELTMLAENIAYEQRQLDGAEKIYDWETRETIAENIAANRARIANIDAEVAARRARMTPPKAVCWTSRIDLARKAAANHYKGSHRADVRIYDLTGTRAN